MGKCHDRISTQVSDLTSGQRVEAEVLAALVAELRRRRQANGAASAVRTDRAASASHAQPAAANGEAADARANGSSAAVEQPRQHDDGELLVGMARRREGNINA